MDRLHEMTVLRAIAETGSFSRAARRLRLSPPAVSRAMAALEERLGARLIQRTTRSLRLTEQGLRFRDACARILAEIEAAEREVAGTAAAVRGALSITASSMFGRLVLMPIVSDFLSGHPDARVSLLLVDRVVNLVEEGIDLGVRIGELPESRLIARRLGKVRRVLVASPAYLRDKGVPESLSALEDHRLIVFTGLIPGTSLRFGPVSAPRSVTPSASIEVNDAAAALGASKAGHGITLVLDYMVREALAEGALCEVLGDAAPPPVPVHFVYPESRLQAATLSAFLDFAAPRIRYFLADGSAAGVSRPSSAQAEG